MKHNLEVKVMSGLKCMDLQHIFSWNELNKIVNVGVNKDFYFDVWFREDSNRK